MYLNIKDKTILNIVNFLKIKNKKILHWIAIIEEFSERLEKNHSFLMSAGVAFNIVLYLMPLFLIAIYIVNLIFDVNTLNTSIESIVLSLLPPTESTISTLKNIIHEVSFIMDNSSLAGWIGIITLLWLSSTLIGSFRVALNRIFNIYAPQIFLVYRIRDIALTITIAFLLLFSTYIFPIVSVFQNSLLEKVPEYLKWLFSNTMLTGITLTTYFIMFYLMFKFIPTKKVARKIRLNSTILCVIFVEISRNLFAWYVGSISSYGKFYGAYAILASMGLWIYYLVLVILLSAEVSKLRFDLPTLIKNQNSNIKINI
jgi:membrane protein